MENLKKGYWIISIGFFVGILSDILLDIGTPPMVTGYSYPALFPTLTLWRPFFLLISFIVLPIIAWGFYFVLRSKQKSLWWLVILIPISYIIDGLAAISIVAFTEGAVGVGSLLWAILHSKNPQGFH